jgi:Bacteriophage tail sheath protein
MSTQVSFPGIYIQEFAPQPPIQGVSTSIGCFIGTASIGPINTPTLITSWEQFQNVFGGLINEPPNSADRSWLAPAVYQFFLNQGTTCWILRTVALPSGTTSLLAAVSLPPVSPVQPQTPYTLVATSIAEGTIGNSTAVTVQNSSRLASMLAAGGPTLQATGSLTAGAPSIQVSYPSSLGSFSLPIDMPITVTLGNLSETVTVTSWAVNPGPPPTATIGIAPKLANTYSAAAPPYATIAVTALQTAGPVSAGQLTFNVLLPPPSISTFVLSQALPAGALIQISGGPNSELVRVVSSGPASTAGQGTITVASGLVHGYPSGSFITSLEFTLVVTAATTETWPLLSMNSQHPGYWQTSVNSQYITLSLPPQAPQFSLTSPAVVPDPNPEPGNYPLLGGTNDDRGGDLTDLNANPQKYLSLLAPIQNVDLIAIPGNVNANTQQALIAHCETLFNRFAILDSVQDTAPGFPNLLAQYGQVRTPNGFAAIYFPWIQVVNPLTGATEFWPPSGSVIGCIAQTDAKVGVFKAPANIAIAQSQGLQTQLADADQGPLNLLGINCLRVFPEQSQPLIWGARTTSTDSSWQYINVRRLFIYIEQSLEQGLRPFLFQPNNPFLWGSMTRTITEFLNRVKSDGGIIKFYVKINATNNPPSVQALGQLYAEIGIQPAYPAEFIILRIGIWQGGSSITES